MWAETIDGASRHIMLGEIGPPGLSVLGTRDSGALSWFCTSWEPEEGQS